MSYSAVYLCSTCKAKLSEYRVFYSSGVCPRCGAVSEGRVIDHEKDAVQRLSALKRLLRWCLS